MENSILTRSDEGVHGIQACQNNRNQFQACQKPQYTGISHLFEADARTSQTRTLPRKHNSNASQIDFSYVPTPRTKPQRDLDQVVFRPDSRGVQYSGRCSQQYSCKSDHCGSLFVPDRAAVKSRYFAQKDSSQVYSAFGIMDRLQ